VFNPEFENAFDRVLCDVPCSGFGVLSSKPDIKLFRKESDLTELATLQSKILETSARYVKPGGSLIYSTCTVFKKENEGVIENFANPDFVTESTQQFLPHRDNLDGFFIAKLKRLSEQNVINHRI